MSNSPKKPRRVRWQLQKRKLQFQLRTNFGKELAAPDDVYEQHEQRFLGLLQKLLDIRKSLDHYRVNALPIYCSACARLGADVWCVVSVDAVGKGADAEKFRHAMCAINETKEAKNHFFNADAVLSGALRFLDIHINAMKSVKSQIKHRKHVKLDFDCYESKVNHLRARAADGNGGSSHRLERNEIKLETARQTLQSVTFDLYRVFAKYESERDTMLNGELEMVRQVMHNFYAKNAEATDFAIPEELDREQVDARTEQIFKRMIASENNEGKQSILPRNSLSTEPQSMTLERLPSNANPEVALSPTADANNSEGVAPALAAGESKDAGPSIAAYSPEHDPTQQEEEDELSGKLKTIQLTRPKVPVLKPFRMRTPIT